MKRSSREISIFNISALDLFASALGAFILIAIILFPYFPNTGVTRVELEQELESMEQELESMRSALEEAQREAQAAQARAEQAQREAEAAQVRAEEAQRQAEAAQAQAAQAQSELARARAENEELRRGQANLDSCQSQREELQSELETCQEELKRKFLLIVISWGSRDDVDLHVFDPRGQEYSWQTRTHAGSTAKFEEDNTRGPGNEIWLNPETAPGNYEIKYNLYRADSSSVQVRGAMLTPNGRQSFREITLRGRSNPIPYNRSRFVNVVTIHVNEDGDATLRNN